MSQLTRPMSLLALPDRQILDNPLDAVTLFDFTGEAEFGELCFKKGQHVLVFCEDMSEGWTLAMLVDDAGNELVLDPQDIRLTRGLLPQGFVEYIARDDLQGMAQDSVQQADSVHNQKSIDGPIPLDDTSSQPREYASTTDSLAAVAKSAVQKPVASSLVHNEQEGISNLENGFLHDSSASDIPSQGSRTERNDLFDSTADERSEDIRRKPLTQIEKLDQLSAEEFESTQGMEDVGLAQPSCKMLEASSTDSESVQPAFLASHDAIESTPSTAAAVQPDPSNLLPRKTRQVSSGYLRSRDPIERFILDGPSSPSIHLSNDQREIHSIKNGQWVVKIPAFHVAVPSYHHRPATGRGGSEFISFQIVSSIPSPQAPIAIDGDEAESNSSNGPTEYRQIIVDRRYAHFQQLHTILKASLPLLSLPDLPEKRLTGNFEKDFLDLRRRDLERYLRRVSRHALVRSHRAFLEFLGCEDEALFQNSFPRFLMQALTTEPECLFTRIEHDTNYFNSDDLLEEAKEQHERFNTYVRAVEKGGGVEAVQNGLQGYREGVRDTGLAVKDLSHALLLLVSGLAQPADPPKNLQDSEESEDPLQRLRHRAHLHHMQNSQGAFCWRDECSDCLSTTKAVQGTAEALATLSDLYEANATTVLLPPQELLVEYFMPRQRYETLLSRHETATKRLEEVLQIDEEAGEAVDDKLVSRCETVLSATSAEIEQAHLQQQQDLRSVAVSVLDGQIAFHEHALEKLRAARASYAEPAFQDLAAAGPRLPSLLERAALAPPVSPDLLPRPSSFGLPSKALSLSFRPMNMLGGLLTGAAGSVFGWRSASSAIRAQNVVSDADLRNSASAMSSNMAASRFVQFLDWTMNSRGEQRKYAS